MSEPRYPYLHVVVEPGEDAAIAAELLSDQLWELGALGIEHRDTATLVRTLPGTQLTLVASFADDAGADAAKRVLEPDHRVSIEHVVGDAWRDEWRKYFKPLRVGERLVVKPSWEPYEAQPSDIVITLDPGQAFGTGTHESTQLVLAELPKLVQPGVRLLDVGCGSGILSVAALLLGAAHATTIDLDPLAIDATRENAEANGVSAAVSASMTPVAELSEQFPLVLANIEATVLVPLAAAIAARVAPGGALVLSGLLLADGEPVRAAYPGFEVEVWPKKGDWCALVLRKARA